METIDAEPKPKLIRTLLRADVYDRLLYIAQALSTGRGHWDFGVAIERLLDEHEVMNKILEHDARIEALETQNTNEDTNTNTNPLGLIGKRFKESEKKNGKD